RWLTGSRLSLNDVIGTPPRNVAALSALLERLLVRIKKSPRCWVWQGALSSQGQALFYLGEKKFALAHRVVEVLVRGTLPAGMAGGEEYATVRDSVIACVNGGDAHAP